MCDMTLPVSLTACCMIHKLSLAKMPFHDEPIIGKWAVPHRLITRQGRFSFMWVFSQADNRGWTNLVYV